MKRFTLAFAVLAAFASLEPCTPAMTKAAMKQMQGLVKNVCKNKSGVAAGVLEKARKGTFEEDDKFKCYLKCCLGMMQTMKNDKISVENARKQVESLLPVDMKEPTLRQLEACKDSSGTDACDLAYRFVVCSYNFDKSNFFIPF